MALTPGTKIGSYEVTAQIGVGGMGEVYRATDTNLGRAVAIKVLPDAVAGDAERLARFDREARTLASLNHPNIAQIHGLEKSGSQTALVMELVEGPTLADRIAAGPIAVGEALAIAKQIAEALEAAHEQGIVHRDLKPANVKVRADGTVKVLDFGLAKAMDPMGAMSPGLTQSPTITTPAMTQAGLILGTAAYMSPEQARGKTVDRRADVWAFGCVLFEMLSGTRAFEDEDVSLTLSKVLRLDPAFDALPPDVPARVAQALRVCLLKDPRQRASDIHDVRLALEGAFETVVTQAAEGPAAQAGAQPPWRRGLPYAVAVALTAAAVALAMWALTRPAPPQVARLPILTTPLPVIAGGEVPDLAISPDGRRVVYDGPGAQLYVQELARLEAAPLRGGEGQWPFFSPDGRWVGFWSPGNGLLRRVPISGGPAETITESAGFDGATWGADDTIIFAMRGRANGLFRVPASGGDAEQLTMLEEGETAHRWPHLLPGGEVVLFTVVRGEATQVQAMDIVALDLASGERHLLVRGGSNPRWAPTGHLVYGVDGLLRAVRFDADTLTVTGDPVSVLQGVLTQSSGAVHYGLASDGSLVYLPGGAVASEARTLVWLDRAGNESPAEVTETRAFSVPRLSPDGTRLAVEADGDVWVSELALGTLRRLTADPADDSSPLWTPDGERVVFASRRQGAVGLYAVPWDGGGEVERLLVIDDAVAIQPESWAPDGTLAFTYREASGGRDIGILPPGGDGEWERLLDTDDEKFTAAFSPDGEWIAYVATRTARPEVYVRRFPDLRGEQLISREGAFVPTWSVDGRELFFFSLAQGLVARPVEIGVSSLRVAEGDMIVSQPSPNSDFRFGNRLRDYDVSRDGQRVLVSRPVDARRETEGPQPLVLVQHWLEELERLVPNE